MATRSNIGVAPWSFAAMLRLPLPLGIWSGLVSATVSSTFSASVCGIMSHAINAKDAPADSAMARKLLGNREGTNFIFGTSFL